VHLGVIGPQGTDMFQDNIADALRQMGHQVTYLGCTHVRRRSRVTTRVAELSMAAAPALERWYHHRLVRTALARECDAVITTEGNLSPDAVAELRRNRVPVALWYPDHVGNLGRQRMLAAPYTALFFKEPLLVRRLRDTLGLPVWYLPQACNPRRHRPVGEPASQRAIVVVGNAYLSRALLVRRLHDAGIPLVLYGGAVPRWAEEIIPAGLHAGFPVFREDKSRVFRSAAAVLNNLHPAEMHGMNLRLFEAAGAGGAVLCEQRRVLPELFEPGHEVLPFRDFAELVGWARQVLADPELTRKVGDAASRRAHEDHTYEARLPTVLERLA
jgi:spore maturation protein CgeB